MKVLVLGASGMLGHKVFQHLGASGHQVLGTMRGDRATSVLARIPLFAGNNVVWNVDAMNWARLEHLLTTQRPDVVVNAAGVIKQRSQPRLTIQSVQVNGLMPHLVAEAIAPWNGRLIHISTDCVFSGNRGRYRETDVQDADDVYGKSKSLGEVVDRRNAVTLRTSMIGRELQHHQSLLDWLLSQNHRPVQGYARVIYSGSTTIELAKVIDLVIREHPSLHGLYHVVTGAISKDALLRVLIDAYRLDIEVTSVDTPVSDRSLIGERFRAATGYVAPPWPQLAAALAADPTPYAEWLSLIDKQPAS
jgi:dTDP-4-dehydrorhamnose reductase